MFTPLNTKFYSLEKDKILIPYCDVSKFDELDAGFVENWREFISGINSKKLEFNPLKKSLDGYKITPIPEEKMMIKAYNTVIYNFPDIFDCSEEQILSLLRSGCSLNDIKIRTYTSIISYEKLSHYSMDRFNVSTKENLLKFLDGVRESILVGICIWWGYDLNDKSKKKF